MAWTERYVSVAGGGAHDGTTEADAWTLAEAIAAPYAAGQRINVKAGTYANTTNTRTFGVAGTTTAPIWWRGYNTTIGDLDSSHALALPAITFTTGVFDITGSYHIFSNLDISGASVTTAQVRMRTGSNCWLDRCRVENTAANAAGRAVSLATANQLVTRSFLKSTASADVVAADALGATVIGCAIVNGKDGVAIIAIAACVVAFCTFRDQAANAISANGANRYWLLNNSIYSPVSDGLDINTTVTAWAVVANNIISECGAFGLTNGTGTNTANIIRLHNDFYSNSSGNENGFGDTPSLAEQTESSSPFTSSTDLTIGNGSNAIANGLPGLFENESYTSYLDIGAVQRVEPASGGMLRHPGMNGGLNG